MMKICPVLKAPCSKENCEWFIDQQCAVVQSCENTSEILKNLELIRDLREMS